MMIVMMMMMMMMMMSMSDGNHGLVICVFQSGDIIGSLLGFNFFF